MLISTEGDRFHPCAGKRRAGAHEQAMHELGILVHASQFRSRLLWPSAGRLPR
jgi:hypothetical protein